MNNHNLEQHLSELMRLYNYSDEQIQEVKNAYFRQSSLNDYQFDGYKFRVNIPFQNKSSNPDPDFNKKGDSGFDLRADLPEGMSSMVYSQKYIKIDPFDTYIVPTGLFFQIPEGYEMQIRPRSGVVAKSKITVANSPGTIDSNYRGEIKVILYNFKNKEDYIYQGDRIAQAVISNVIAADSISLNNADNLNETNRNEEGFGSTGFQ
jgi:dUTP pyrophosphatase